MDFRIAHLKIQNVNVAIVFLNQAFDHKPDAEKNEIQASLQLCARGAGIAGNVVPVWLDSLGRMKFIAPHNQHPFFSSVNYDREFSATLRKAVGCDQDRVLSDALTLRKSLSHL